MQVEHLLSVPSSGSNETPKTIRKSLDEKIASYAAGELKHAREAVSLIWESSRKPQATGIPSDTDLSLPVAYMGLRKSGLGATLRKLRVRFSLIKSIQGKSLLYRRYWARTSQGGRICPIYFPNAVPSSVSSQVTTREWRYTLESMSILNQTVIECLNTRAGRLGGDEEHEFSEDSDCQSERELKGGTVTGNAGAGCGEQKLLPVLKIGSFAA